MLRRLSPIILATVAALATGGLLAAAPVHAQYELDLGQKEIAKALKLPETDPRTIAVHLINISLEFLAALTVVIVIYGGFLFMVSGGKPENTKRAGAVIRNAFIGLIIILSSWGFVRFLLVQLVAATTGTTPPNPL